MSLHIAKSTIHGMGLFSDTELAENEDVAVVFSRVNDTGIFINDFIETHFGRHTNHSDNPTTEIIIRPDDIILRATRTIKSSDEITASYHQLIDLFNQDPTLIMLIKFW
jgi:hypothetical protein